MRASVSEFECLLMYVFVFMYTQVRACVSAFAQVCRHALGSVKNPHSNRKHNSKKVWVQNCSRLKTLIFKVRKNVENL